MDIKHLCILCVASAWCCCFFVCSFFCRVCKASSTPRRVCVCLRLCLYFCPSVCISFVLCIYISVFVSVCLSACLHVYLSICLSVCSYQSRSLFVSLWMYVCSHPSSHPPIHPHPSNQFLCIDLLQTIHSSIYPSTHLSTAMIYSVYIVHLSLYLWYTCCSFYNNL